MRTLILLLSFLPKDTISFTTSYLQKGFVPVQLPITSSSLHSTTTPPSTTNPSSDQSKNEQIQQLKSKIQTEITPTNRGLSASTTQQKNIDTLIQQLETNCPLSEPARSPWMGGKWIVDYTTAPPPSNGKLGPFEGFARQIIDLDAGTYVNYLSVPGEIELEWLSAKLEATFSEWDGVFLEDDRDDSDNNKNTGNTENIDDGDVSSEKIDEEEEEEEQEVIPTNDENSDNTQKSGFFSSLKSIFSRNKKDIVTSTPISIEKKEPDYGALNWKVDFQTLKIQVFGFTLITKEFENTSRIWKMSYLDEETRVVRAGRTGKDEDNMLFYMSRE